MMANWKQLNMFSLYYYYWSVASTCTKIFRRKRDRPLGFCVLFTLSSWQWQFTNSTFCFCFCWRVNVKQLFFWCVFGVWIYSNCFVCVNLQSLFFGVRIYSTLYFILFIFYFNRCVSLMCICNLVQTRLEQYPVLGFVWPLGYSKQNDMQSTEKEKEKKIYI